MAPQIDPSHLQVQPVEPLIQVLSLRDYFDTKSQKYKKTDNKHYGQNWRANSVPDLLKNCTAHAEAIPTSERYNIFYTVAACGPGKRQFRKQDVLLFDIDGIDPERSEDYVSLVCNLLGVSKDDIAVVFSGHGLHFIIWLSITITDSSYFEINRRHYNAVCAKITAHLSMHHLPGKADTSVFDAARIMRLPGTLNVKEGKNTVEATLLFNNLKQVHFDISSASGLPKVNADDHIDAQTLRKHPKPDTSAVLSGCDFLKACKAAPESVSEEQWYASLSILPRLEGGHDLAHEYSRGHSGYSFSETDAKLEQALSASGPRTCANINRIWGKCASCPNFEKVTSPISIRGPEYAKIRLGDISCLGYSGSNYYYSSPSNPQINQIREHSEMDLLKLQPYERWVDAYGQLNQKGTLSINWTKAKSDMTQECRRKGIFDSRRVRGRGVWTDQDRVIVHLGDRLYYDGVDHPITDPPKNTRHIYEYSKGIAPIAGSPLSLEELKPMVELLGLFNYAKEGQKYYLGGYLATASICGALSWRPHVWLTGESGSGKSTAQDRLMKPILQAFELIFAQGGTTEAGLRQSLRGDAIPVIFDEFEAESKKSAGRVESCLELMRQASSDGAGQIIKGSASGEAQKYYARFAALVSSVKPKLVCDADRARFTLVELTKVFGHSTRWDQLDKMLGEITEEFSARFFARMVQMIPTILENQRLLQRAFTEKHSNRFGQQYGTLLAGWAALISDNVLNDSEIAGLVGSVEIREENAGSAETDQVGCLQYLLNKRIRLDVASKTVLELVQSPDANLKTELMRHGMAIVHPRSEVRGECLFVAGPGHPETAAIFRDSKWEGTWDVSLGRLPGATRGYQVRQSGQNLPRGVLVPMKSVVEEFTASPPPQY